MHVLAFVFLGPLAVAIIWAVVWFAGIGITLGLIGLFVIFAGWDVLTGKVKLRDLW